MIDLLEMHKMFIRAHLSEGGIAADFTMGNGNDTEFLCRTVGESGHVYAFDIQEDAISSTRARLEKCGFSNYTLIHDSHANLKEYIKTPIKAGMFNLGYLPGHEEGTLEGEMLTEYLATLSRYKLCATKVRIVNSPTSPYFFVIESK